MKIETAKTKWCPHARILEQNIAVGSSSNGLTFNGMPVLSSVPQPGVAGVNRQHGAAHMSCRCIADGCMAWRTVLGDPDDGHCGLSGFAPHGGGV